VKLVCSYTRPLKLVDGEFGFAEKTGITGIYVKCGP